MLFRKIYGKFQCFYIITRLRKAAGSGDLEYGNWRGKSVGGRWGDLTSRMTLATYTSDDLMSIPKKLQFDNCNFN